VTVGGTGNHARASHRERMFASSLSSSASMSGGSPGLTTRSLPCTHTLCRSGWSLLRAIAPRGP